MSQPRSRSAQESQNPESEGVTTEMKQTFTLWLTVTFLGLGVSALETEHHELKFFPSAKEGMSSFV